jgi:hypothetical protein
VSPLDEAPFDGAREYGTDGVGRYGVTPVSHDSGQSGVVAPAAPLVAMYLENTTVKQVMGEMFPTLEVPA